MAIKTPNNTELLNKIENTDSDDLGQNVAKSEGISGAVIPQYSKRRINYIHVSKSELKDLMAFNWGTGISFSFGSFFFALWIDIFKDKKLSESIPLETQVILSYIEPVLIMIAGLFVLLGIVLWFLKDRKIKNIIKECTSLD